jgi:DNA-binding transcriptional ArsR family regulator
MKIINEDDGTIECGEIDVEEYTEIEIGFRQARGLLTDKRIEILEELSENDLESITDLSDKLGRTKTNVSKDIKKMYESGIIDLEENGRMKKPVFKFNKITITSLDFEENSKNPGINYLNNSPHLTIKDFETLEPI